MGVASTVARAVVCFPGRPLMAALDKLYRSILVATRFFSRGWGPTHAYER